MNTTHLIQAAAALDENTLAHLKKLAIHAGEQVAEMFPYQRRPSLGARVFQGGGFVLLGVAAGVAAVAITYAVNPKFVASVGKFLRTAAMDAEEGIADIAGMAEAVIDEKNNAVDKVTHLSEVKDEGARHKGGGNGHKSHSPS